MRRTPPLAVLALTLALAGCGQPAYDGSSPEAAKASVERMTAGMTDAEKREFAADLMAIGLREAMPAAFQAAAKGEKPDPNLLHRSLHGLTRDQIKAKGAAIRAEMQAARPPAPSGA